PRETSFVGGIPGHRYSDSRTKICSMRISHFCLKRLRAAGKNKRRRKCSRFKAELIFHPAATEYRDRFIDGVEIRLTSNLFDLVPGNMQTNAAEIVILAQLRLELFVISLIQG